ncbi:MAG: hypothetical protein ACI9FN_003412 [Saprospiraceae bacterium]|jgi:hypothetical protein
MYRALVFLVFLLVHLIAFSQDTLVTSTLTIQEVIKERVSKHQKEIDSLNKQLALIKDSLQEYPIWKIGGGALSGFDFNSFSNWANRGENINSSASSFNLGVNGFLNKKGENHFWRNQARINVGWQKFRRSDEDVEAQFEKIADMLQLVTHYGYNICPEIAMSALSEWESNLIDQTINPSYLDMSLGFTWTPNLDLVSIMHPISYEFALADEEGFESSLGAKLIFEYSKSIEKRISLQSNFSGFISYEELDFLSNFTWRNGVKIKFFKGIGLGLEYALRVSRQETIAIDLTDEHLQSYLVMGMSFELP